MFVENYSKAQMCGRYQSSMHILSGNVSCDFSINIMSVQNRVIEMYNRPNRNEEVSYVREDNNIGWVVALKVVPKILIC